MKIDIVGTNGHLECLKYARDNGCPYNKENQLAYIKVKVNRHLDESQLNIDKINGYTDYVNNDVVEILKIYYREYIFDASHFNKDRINDVVKKRKFYYQQQHIFDPSHWNMDRINDKFVRRKLCY
jgi:hypothetical protein